MNVLVLGGSYFIGRAIVDRLLADGHRVTLLNRGSRRVDGVEQLVADRGDVTAIGSAVGPRTFDWIIDTSCYGPAQAEAAIQALAGRFGSWLYLSTAAVYPGGSSRRVKEDEVGPGREWEDYGRNKLLAERVLERHFDRQAHERLLIVRAPYVYGPRNTLPREAWLWARMLQRRPIWMPGSGTTLLHFVHVEDLADAMVVMLTRAEATIDVVNVAQRETPSIREYLETLAAVAGVDAQIEPVDYHALGMEARAFFPFRDYPCLLDTDHVTGRYDWRAHYDMRGGLEQTYAQLERPQLLATDTTIAVEDRLLASRSGGA